MLSKDMRLQLRMIPGPRNRADVRAVRAVPQDKAPLPLPPPDGVPALHHQHLQHPPPPHPAGRRHETLAQDELGGLPNVVSYFVIVE